MKTAIEIDRRERPVLVARAAQGIEDDAGEERRADEVGDVEDDDVPARPRADGFREEGERDRDRGESRRKDQDRREDRRQREVGALMLLPLGPDEVHDRDEREEDAERQPLVVGDLLGPADQGHARNGQPDDCKLERGRSRAQPTDRALGTAPHRTDRARARKRPYPHFGDKTGLLDPSNE